MASRMQAAEITGFPDFISLKVLARAHGKQGFMARIGTGSGASVCHPTLETRSS